MNKLPTIILSADRVIIALWPARRTTQEGGNAAASAWLQDGQIEARIISKSTRALTVRIHGFDKPIVFRASDGLLWGTKRWTNSVLKNRPYPRIEHMGFEAKPAWVQGEDPQHAVMAPRYTNTEDDGTS